MQQDHLEMLREDIRGKFDLVLEGHAALDRKIDAVEEQLGKKIDAVAADLKAHRGDTEAH